MLDFKIPEQKPFDQLLSLKGKVAIVTGGSRGIGYQVAARFAQAGATVVITGRGLDGLEKAAEGFKAQGLDVDFMQADVSSVADSQRVVDDTVARHGRLDILVNNAASFPFATTLDATEETWDKCFDVDAKGTFFMSQIAARRMIEQGDGGRIVNFLSTAALTPTDMLVVYGAAKQAVHYVTRTMAQAFAPAKVTVNCVTPGATMTAERAAAFGGDASKMESFIESSGNAGSPMAKLLENASSSDAFAQSVGKVLSSAMPMGRPGSPDDLALAVLYLASDMAAYVTGQNIVVDGAQSLQNPTFAIAKTVLPGADQAFGSVAPAADADDEEEEPVPSDAAPKGTIDGTWVADVKTPMGENRLTLVLESNGSGVTGKAVVMGNDVPLDSGSIHGDQVHLAVKVKGPIGKVTGKVSATLEGDVLDGQIKMMGQKLAFCARRQS